MMDWSTTLVEPTTGASFLQDGFRVLPSLLSRSEVDRLRSSIGRSLSAAGASGCERPNNTLVALRWSDEIVADVLGDTTRVDRLVDAMDATDLRWISGYLSIKEPHTGPLWWHQDWWCWDHPVSFRPQAAQVALLCYLGYTDERRGALRVLPGTHHRATSLRSVLPAAHTDAADTLPDNHPAMSDQPDQVTLAMRPGDAVVTDYRLLHGTHPNAGPDRRDALLLSFAPAWRDLPADIRGHLIQHPAQPTDSETPTRRSWADRLLPSHHGPRTDLALNREPPASFAVSPS